VVAWRASWNVCTVGAAALVFAALRAPPACAFSSADELVREARAHEQAREEDIALRRYTEALTIDPTNAGAWIGLGALRMKLGEPAEAERVYASALDRVPTLRSALAGRARALWALGHRPEAEADLEAYATIEGDTAALLELAGWFGAEGRTPAQLATWRRLLAMHGKAGDAELVREARRMVRALIVLVDSADPASSPVEPDATRRALARIARRVGHAEGIGGP
jgi:tetratricopeptide (TPR) repeat protein